MWCRNTTIVLLHIHDVMIAVSRRCLVPHLWLNTCSCYGCCSKTYWLFGDWYDHSLTEWCILSVHVVYLNRQPRNISPMSEPQPRTSCETNCHHAYKASQRGLESLPRWHSEEYRNVRFTMLYLLMYWMWYLSYYELLFAAICISRTACWIPFFYFKKRSISL